MVQWRIANLKRKKWRKQEKSDEYEDVLTSLHPLCLSDNVQGIPVDMQIQSHGLFITHESSIPISLCHLLIFCILIIILGNIAIYLCKRNGPRKTKYSLSLWLVWFKQGWFQILSVLPSLVPPVEFNATCSIPLSALIFPNIIREKAEITNLFLNPNSFIHLEMFEIFSKFRKYLDKDKYIVPSNRHSWDSSVVWVFGMGLTTSYHKKINCLDIVSCLNSFL